MSETIIYGVAVIPAIVGLVEAAKRLGMDARFAPLLAVALGVVAGLAEAIAGQHPQTQTYVQATFAGVAMGLASAGLYSGVKTVLPGSDVTAPAQPASETAAPTVTK